MYIPINKNSLGIYIVEKNQIKIVTIVLIFFWQKMILNERKSLNIIVKANFSNIFK